MITRSPISTPRVVLRRFTTADTRQVFLMSQEDGMRTWIPSQVYRDEAHTSEVLYRLISHYASGGDPREHPFVLGVQLKSSGDLVGHVGLSPFEDTVEIGYAIERAYHHKGLASEAARAMCHWAMAEYRLDSIVGVVAQENIASQSVLLRAGFARKEARTMWLQGEEQWAVIYEFRSNCVDSGSLRLATSGWGGSWKW